MQTDMFKPVYTVHGAEDKEIKTANRVTKPFLDQLISLLDAGSWRFTYLYVL